MKAAMLVSTYDLQAEVEAKSRAEAHEPATVGEHIADRAAAFIGSWRFIIIQTALVLLWIGGNLWLLGQPFDPFPFILLNLGFSTQAAYTGPILLLAGNRQAQRDRALAAKDDQELSLLMEIQNEQIEILRRLDPGPPPHG